LIERRRGACCVLGALHSITILLVTRPRKVRELNERVLALEL